MRSSRPSPSFPYGGVKGHATICTLGGREPGQWKSRLARGVRIVVDKQTDRQTHRTTTVTLAAHARRGLMTVEMAVMKKDAVHAHVHM